jgi:hypothetical protein
MKKTSHIGFVLCTSAFVAYILSLDHQSRYQKFPLINISSIQNYQGLILLVTFTGLADLFPQLESLHDQLCGDILYLAFVVQYLNTYNCWMGPGFEFWMSH